MDQLLKKKKEGCTTFGEIWRRGTQHWAEQKLQRRNEAVRKKNYERFFKDPYQFARRFFQKPRSAQKEELATHLMVCPNFCIKDVQMF